MKHLGDITKLSGYDVPIVDCLIGGSPCQDLSVAGKRAGMKHGELGDDETTRSGLFMEQIRVVKEMRDNDELEHGHTGYRIRPRFMVWENVPGAFSSNGGKDFQAVLSEIVRIIRPNAPDVPLPDGGGKWTKAGVLYGELGDWSVAWRVHDAQFWGVPQRRKRIALVADFGGLAAPEVLFERKGLCWDPEQGGEEGEGTASGAEKSSAIPIEGNGYRPSHRGSGIGEEGDPSFTLNAVEHHGVAYGFDGNQVNALCMDVGFFQTQKEQAGSLLARQYKDPPIVTYQEKTGALMTSGYDKLGTQEASNDMYVTGPTVRRLTPKECERLQGFPDDWTNLGEWTDSSGKIHKEAESHRYKALGNSIAVGYANNGSGFWMWLLKRISAQYERNATLGSLFDGIGGFPLAWEHFNGKGSAVWASEIEEFPIAVTKKHFPETAE